MLACSAWRVALAAPIFIAVLAAAGKAGAGETAYLDAMAACRAAAEDATDPTDFACDWKAVIDGAPGAALTGKYKFREDGMSGEMTILDSGFEPADIGIMTVTESDNAPTCTARFGASRNDNDELAATMDDPAGCDVRIVSVPGPNIVKVTASEACNAFCGMGAAFAGEWQLQDK